MSWAHRGHEELAPVKEDSQDDEETGSGSPSPGAQAQDTSMGSPSPLPRFPGPEHSLREKFTEEGGPKPTLTGTAKGAALQPSAPAFSPFAALAGSALDTNEDDSLEIGMMHERSASGKEDGHTKQ